MKPREEAILRLLLEHGEQRATQLAERSDGLLTHGNAYVWLSMLENQRLVSSRCESVAQHSKKLPQRLYKITTDGRVAIGT
jgi:DNA-binding PadR family transcriptional regulator